jgi:hypothetical protein
MDVIASAESELELPAGMFIYGRKEIWPHLSQMHEGYLAAAPVIQTHEYWRSSYAVVAYLAGKYDVARTQLAAMDWKIPPERLDDWDVDLSLMTLEVAARSGTHAKLVERGEDQYGGYDLQQALQTYREIASATNADEVTRLFALHRVATLDLEVQLFSGEWVDILNFPDVEELWTVPRGNLKQISNGALEIVTKTNGHIAFLRARAGSNLEIKGEFEIVKSSNKSFQAGIVMGSPPNVVNSEW